MGKENLSQLKTWVDAAYGIHPELKSHTRGRNSFGYGILNFYSRKKRFNTKRVLLRPKWLM